MLVHVGSYWFMLVHVGCYFHLDAVCDNMRCSGHGTCVDGECVCDRLYTGEICQIKGTAL